MRSVHRGDVCPPGERRALALWLHAIGKNEKPPDAPDWLNTILLAERLHKLPGEIEGETALWIARYVTYLSLKEKANG